jgi:nitrogen regulatory protein P-II 1
MKQIQAIIRREKLGEVMKALESIKCPGMMVWEIEGYGKQKGLTEQFRGREFKLALLPKAKIEIVVTDGKVKETVDAIINVAATGNVGDGKIFISTVDEAIKIRTRESGDVAVA